MTKTTRILLVVGLVVVTVGVGVTVAKATGDVNNAFVPALTAALVWVTAYYAIVTAKIMEATEKQTRIALEAQYNAAVPVISLDASVSQPPGHSESSQIMLSWRNIGKGPALNFRCWIEDSEHPALLSRQNAVCQAAVPTSASQDIFNSTILITEIQDYVFGIGYVRAQYQSIFGKTYESCLMFPKNDRPQLEWGAVKEL